MKAQWVNTFFSICLLVTTCLLLSHSLWITFSVNALNRTEWALLLLPFWLQLACSFPFLLRGYKVLRYKATFPFDAVDYPPYSLPPYHGLGQAWITGVVCLWLYGRLFYTNLASLVLPQETGTHPLEVYETGLSQVLNSFHTAHSLLFLIFIAKVLHAHWQITAWRRQ